MKIILVVIGIGMALLGRLLNRKWYNPASVFSLYWIVLSVISMIGAFGFNVPSDKTFLIISLSIISFGVGAMCNVLSPKIQIIFGEKTHREQNNYDFEINYRVIYILSIITILYLLLRSFTTIRLLLQGQSLDVIREIYFNDDNIDNSNFILSSIDSFIIKPLSMAIISITSADFFTEKRDKKLLPLTIVIVLLSVLVNGGRVVILYLVINMITCMAIKRIELHFTKKQKRILLVVVFAAFAGIIIVTTQRKSNVIFLEEIYRYFSGSISQFDARLNRLGDSFDYTNGFATLRGFIMPIAVVLKKIIGFNYSQAYVAASEIGTSLQHSIVVGDGVWMKAFCTLFYFFYYDGGYVGVVFFSFIYGMLSSAIYRKAMLKQNILATAQYGLLMQGILLSMVRWQFYIPGYAWSFVFLHLLVCRRKSGTLTDSLHKFVI